MDALQHWLNSEQHLLVVVDPSDEERRASQVQPMGLKSRSIIEWVLKFVVEIEGWAGSNRGCWVGGKSNVSVMFVEMFKIFGHVVNAGLVIAVLSVSLNKTKFAHHSSLIRLDLRADECWPPPRHRHTCHTTSWRHYWQCVQPRTWSYLGSCLPD